MDYRNGNIGHMMIRRNLLVCISCFVIFISSLVIAYSYFVPSSGRLRALIVPPQVAGESVSVPTAVSTFHSIGIYWSPSDGSITNAAAVRYRQQGANAWRDGFPLWYDPRALGGRPAEYRGSLVHLTPDTSYEIELRLASGSATTLTAKTWNENFPISTTIPVQNSTQTLNINVSGTAQGYALYSGPATIDVEKTANYNIEVSASYVIIRGLTLKGAKQHGIYLRNGVHDVVIENNDISAWGSVASGETTFGAHMHSGVYAYATIDALDSARVERIVIQRNKFHHPSFDTNSWLEKLAKCGSTPCHPEGSQAVSLVNSLGNHVIRYNEVFSDDDHFFNDGISGGNNYSYLGFPNKDSDIYANYLERAYDNPIESEGANMNVRIWGNFIDKSYKPIAIAATSIGPIYIWRNVSSDSCYGPCWGSSGTVNSDSDERGTFLKDSSKVNNGVYWGDGKIYLFHNTTLQFSPPPGKTWPLGVGGGVGGGGTGVFGRNNIWYVHKPIGYSISDSITDTSYLKKNDHNFDLYNGVIQNSVLHERDGFRGIPNFTANVATRQYPLASGGSGFDQGERIANFNDDFVGAGPDVGAYEAGAPSLEFGRDAYRKSISPPVRTPTLTPTGSTSTSGQGIQSLVTNTQPSTPPPAPTCVYSPNTSIFGGTYFDIQAENWMNKINGSGIAANKYWWTTTALSGYKGAGAVQALPNTGTNVGDSVVGPRLDYGISVSSPGYYYVYVRGYSPDPNSDSVHIGLNGIPASYGRYGLAGFHGSYSWRQKTAGRPTRLYMAAGDHSLNMWMREDGAVIDEIVLSTRSNLSGTTLNLLPDSGGWREECVNSI